MRAGLALQASPHLDAPSLSHPHPLALTTWSHSSPCYSALVHVHTLAWTHSAAPGFPLGLTCSHPCSLMLLARATSPRTPPLPPATPWACGHVHAPLLLGKLYIREVGHSSFPFPVPGDHVV